MTELYRDRDLAARARPGSDLTRWVVTFDNHGGNPSLERKGFAEDFLATQGLSAIHVVGSGNHWYQYPGMTAALAAIKRATSDAARVVTYGSSMGAYAAVRAARAVGAHGVLALSPQYSIDPAKMPNEHRWEHEGRTIAFREEIDGMIEGTAAPIIIYDPRDPDAAHVERIGRDIAVERIALPYVGHPSTAFLAMGGLLGPAILAHAAGTLDVAVLRQNLFAARKVSPVYLSELAGRLPPTRIATAIALARKALARAPTEALFQHRLAKLLTRAGAHEEALALHASAVDLSKGYHVYGMTHVEGLLAAGDAAGAVVRARGLIARDRDNAVLHSLLAHALWTSGDAQDARATAATAFHLDPGNARYEAQLNGYARSSRVKLWRRRAGRWLKRLT